MQIKTSFISTVLNEEKSIAPFLDSLFSQTFLPDEIIIVDGGSTDATASVISNFQFQMSNRKIKFKLIIKKGNRSVGRNEAIRQAKNGIILCSDAGCVLEKNWVKEITKPFRINSDTEVVAGFYSSKANSIFEKCLVPYVLVMPDKVKENSFLPSARSMAFRKSIWKKIGGFKENLSDNEDYYFAKKLKEKGMSIKFVKDAKVYWIPRKSIYQAAVMFYRFAKGDIESGIFRPKVVFIFIRYLFGLLLLTLLCTSYSTKFLLLLMFIVSSYLYWSIKKNYKYVNDYRAIFILPILQITSDIVIIIGSFKGLIRKKWDILAAQ